MGQALEEDIADDEEQQGAGQGGAEVEEKAENPVIGSARPERGFISISVYHPFFRLRSVLRTILMSMMKRKRTRAMENRACRCRPEA